MEGHMDIVWLRPDELIPYPANIKVHPPAQVDHIANSIKQFGWKQPIVVDKDKTVIIGHGRLLAAKQLLLESVPVVFANDLDEDQVRALRLADNKTNESPYDLGNLAEELAALDIAGIDMTDFGFPEMDDFTDAQTSIAEDDIPDAPVEAVAKRGDIWQLGDHVLMCGDSTDDSDIKTLMAGEKGRMIFTSPPYSDMREYEGGKDLSVGNLCQFISAYRPYTDYQCVNLGIQRKDHDIFEYWNDYIRVARESGYKMLAWNVWDKGMTGNIGQAAAFFPLRHEWVFVFGTEFFEINRTIEKLPDSINDKKPKTKRNADGTTSFHTTGDTSKPYKQMESVLFMHPVLQNNLRDLHPAQFPIGLPAEYIKSMSEPGDIIIEPFGGAGTTLMACEQLGRKCRIMELEPKYVDVIIKRWEDFTGRKAVLLNAPG